MTLSTTDAGWVMLGSALELPASPALRTMHDISSGTEMFKHPLRAPNSGDRVYSRLSSGSATMNAFRDNNSPTLESTRTKPVQAKDIGVRGCDIWQETRQMDFPARQTR